MSSRDGAGCFIMIKIEVALHVRAIKAIKTNQIFQRPENTSIRFSCYDNIRNICLKLLGRGHILPEVLR